MCSVLEFLDNSPTIEEVDRKIQYLRDDIRTLEHYRNARLLIICRLPPDVLSMIFEHLALSKHAISKGVYGHPYRAWLPVSQVCRHWRNVALDTPRMWGCIYDDTSIQFTTLLLERAKSAPLYLRACPPAHFPNDATLKQLLHHSTRLREIELGCDAEDFQSIAKMNLSVLESLSLKNWDRESSGPCRARFDPAIKPGTVPPLRYLSLSDFAFDLDVSFFSHLHTLKLNTDALSVTDVLLALGNMQHLEVLDLVNVVHGLDKIPDNFRVHHPQIRRISVEAERQALQLFAHLSCPNIQSAVAQTGDVVQPEALAPIASAFYSMIPSSPNPWKICVYTMSLTFYYRGEMRIWPESALEDTEPPFRLSVLGPPTFSTNAALVSSLTTGIPHILEFAHGVDLDKSTDDLQAFLRSLEGVRELHIYSINDLLLILSDTTASTNGASFPLPSLKYIYVVSKARKEILHRQQKLKRLGELLIARSDAGNGIEMLKIRCSVGMMTEKDIQHLKPLVGILDFA